MGKQWKPQKKTVALAPSKIRREPLRLDEKVKPESPEREISMTVVGVVVIALACAALIVGIAIVTQRNAQAEAARPAFGQCYNTSGGNCVLDGDTIYLGGQKVELAGFDAPEVRGAECPAEAERGVDAAVRLLALLNKGPVTVARMERDSDGLVRPRIEVGGRDVATAMINAGVGREIEGGRRNWCS